MSNPYPSNEGELDPAVDQNNEEYYVSELSRLQAENSDLQIKLSSTIEQLEKVKNLLAVKSFDLEGSRKASREILEQLHLVQEDLEHYYMLNRELFKLLDAGQSLNEKLKKLVIVPRS